MFFYLLVLNGCNPLYLSQFPRSHFDPKVFRVKVELDQFQKQLGGMILLWYRLLQALPKEPGV